VRRPPMTPIADLLRTDGPLVLLERVADPDNVGGVFRGASAFAASGVILSPGCGDPYYRKTVRTSVGGVLRVPFAHADDWPATLTAVRSAGFVLAALTPRHPSIPLGEFATAHAHARIALLVGTEGDGLTQDAESAADVRVRIVMASGVDSLNVSVAAAIALHAVSRVAD